MRSLTVGERILLHLSHYSNEKDSFVCSPDVSQRGIADAVGVSRAHAALELKKLREAGDVEERVAHVEGGRTRRKVYFLSFGGEGKARGMREHALGRRVSVHDSEGSRELGGDEAFRLLTRSHGWPRTAALVAVLTQDVIDASEEEAAPIEAPEDFFGREGELAALRAWAAREAPAMLVLAGVTGVGKTALLRRFASEFEGTVHYCPVREWDTPASLARTLGASLAAAGRTRLKEYAAASADPGEVASILSVDAAGHLLILDDCIASREGELMAKALVGVPGPKVVAASNRPPSFYGSNELILEKTVEEMTLDGLDEEASRELCERLGLKVPPEEAFRMTGGHPLSLQLMAAAGAEEGIDEPSRFVKEQLMAGLEPREREVLRRASVHRKPFPPSAIGPRASNVLDRLAERGAVRHSGGQYSVPSMVASLVRELLSPQERKEFHSAAADACLETGDELERLHHLAGAGRTQEVAMRIHRVGKGIVESGGAAEMWRLMEEVEPPARYRGPWMLEAGRALDDLGRWDEAEDALSEASELGDGEVRSEAAFLRGRILSKRGRLREARGAFEGLLDAPSASLRADARRGLGVVLRKMGGYDEARRVLREAVDEYERLGAERDRGLALMELGNVALGAGDVVAAQGRLREALGILEGDPVEEPRVRVNLAVASRMAGDLEEALEHLELAADMAGDVGQMRTGVYALSNAADVLLALDDPDRAGEACRLAEEWAAVLQDPVMLSLLRANEGEVAAHRGDVEAARTHFEESVSLLEGVGAPDSLAARLKAYAEAMESLGEGEAATALRERLRDL